MELKGVKGLEFYKKRCIFVAYKNQFLTIMGKKKGGKRLNKRDVAEALQALFQAHPGETLSFKQIFKTLKFDTHPVKMLAIDVMEEMAWDDWLS